ncbi:putative metallopeptidase [Geotalea sp. SG265]|uniref:putative metallopeptidase n=1 Tax=Geotalea sp. SG265 TaxID=2922867 RepID=UPI001FAE9188
MTTLNLTEELERLIGHIVREVPELGHIDTRQLLVCISTTRNGGIHGTYAKIHPLRFAEGARTTTARRGRRTYTCTMPQVEHRGAEILYIIYFLVPRFLNLPQREKLITVFHELYHVSPRFNGDLRRFPGRNYAHGSSTKRYNALMANLVDRYLLGLEDRSHLAFLDGTMDDLRLRHASIVGRKFAAPRLIVEPS